MKIVFKTISLSDFTVTSQDGQLLFTTPDFSVPVVPSGRFWRSLWKALRIPKKLFDYFSPEEVFLSVRAKGIGHSFHACFEDHGSFVRLMGLNAPGKDDFNKTTSLAAAESSFGSSYHDGQIHYQTNVMETSRYKTDAKIMKKYSKIGIGDWMEKRDITPVGFTACPIDGVGQVNHHYGIRFPSGAVLGFVHPSLGHVGSHCDGGGFLFGFSAKLDNATSDAAAKLTMNPQRVLDSRLSHASDSAASLAEIATFYNVLTRHGVEIAKYDQILGCPFGGYGLASHGSLAKSRLASLPAKVTVLDLWTVMATAATESPMPVAVKLHRLAGAMLADYFDFEGMTFEAVLGQVATKADSQPDTVQVTNAVAAEATVPDTMAVTPTVTQAATVTVKAVTKTPVKKSQKPKATPVVKDEPMTNEPGSVVPVVPHSRGLRLVHSATFVEPATTAPTANKTEDAEIVPESRPALRLA